MKREFLRFYELSVRNKYQEQITGLNMVFFEQEIYLFCSLDHTGRSVAEIFNGDSRIVGGQIFDSEGMPSECTEAFFQRERVYYVDSHVRFMNSLNLAENIFLLRPNSLKKVRLNQKAVLLRTQELFARYGLPLRPEQKVESLRAIDKVLLQLVRLADLRPRMLVVNNLSFICNQEDQERLLKILGKIREAGISMLIYDSNPKGFASLADHILLVKKGRIIKKFFERETFQSYWECSAGPVPEGIEKKEPAGKADGEYFRFSWHFPDGKPCSFEIHPGEILYFPSNGWEHQQALCRGMMGLGEGGVALEANGRRTVCKRPDALQKYNIFFWGKERIEDELFPNMSVTDNILMPSLKRISRLGFYRPGERFILQDMDFSEISGEGRQTGSLTDEAVWKLLCYRWKLYHPKMLIAYNVLSRFDPEMKRWMAGQLLQMAGRGTAFALLETADDAAGSIADRVICTRWQGVD